jgi:hypothetical protein
LGREDGGRSMEVGRDDVVVDVIEDGVGRPLFVRAGLLAVEPER